MNKKIDILCNDGSPLGVTYKSIYGEDGRLGVGGAELALLTLCEGFQKRGYDVTLYNNPNEGGASPFKQKTLNEFVASDERDYLIVFRSPNARIINAKGKVIWFSCDQFTVGDFKAFSRQVEKIVTISPFHAKYFKEMYGILDTVTIDLPVRVEDYPEVEKNPFECVYTSIPDRGAMQLHAAWPLIVREVPQARLTLTSDWRLWDADIDRSCVQPYQLAFARHPNVSYVGAVKRSKLVEYQSKANLLLYPCVYDELFCIAVAEAQVAGAIPVTSKTGAVETTNEFGYQIDGSPYEPKFIDEFVQKTVSLLQDKDLAEKQIECRRRAIERFSMDRILQQWEDEVFK